MPPGRYAPGYIPTPEEELLAQQGAPPPVDDPNAPPPPAPSPQSYEAQQYAAGNVYSTGNTDPNGGMIAYPAQPQAPLDPATGTTFAPSANAPAAAPAPAFGGGMSTAQGILAASAVSPRGGNTSYTGPKPHAAYSGEVIAARPEAANPFPAPAAAPPPLLPRADGRAPATPNAAGGAGLGKGMVGRGPGVSPTPTPRRAAVGGPANGGPPAFSTGPDNRARLADGRDPWLAGGDLRRGPWEAPPSLPVPGMPVLGAPPPPLGAPPPLLSEAQAWSRARTMEAGRTPSSPAMSMLRSGGDPTPTPAGGAGLAGLLAEAVGGEGSVTPVGRRAAGQPDPRLRLVPGGAGGRAPAPRSAADDLGGDTMAERRANIAGAVTGNDRRPITEGDARFGRTFGDPALATDRPWHDTFLDGGFGARVIDALPTQGVGSRGGSTNASERVVDLASGVRDSDVVQTGVALGLAGARSAPLSDPAAASIAGGNRTMNLNVAPQGVGETANPRATAAAPERRTPTSREFLTGRAGNQQDGQPRGGERRDPYFGTPIEVPGEGGGSFLAFAGGTLTDKDGTVVGTFDEDGNVTFNDGSKGPRITDAMATGPSRAAQNRGGEAKGGGVASIGDDGRSGSGAAPTTPQEDAAAAEVAGSAPDEVGEVVQVTALPNNDTSGGQAAGTTATTPSSGSGGGSPSGGGSGWVDSGSSGGSSRRSSGGGGSWGGGGGGGWSSGGGSGRWSVQTRDGRTWTFDEATNVWTRDDGKTVMGRGFGRRRRGRRGAGSGFPFGPGFPFGNRRAAPAGPPSFADAPPPLATTGFATAGGGRGARVDAAPKPPPGQKKRTR